MTLPTYVVIFRTHMWDSVIAKAAMNVHSLCPSADFVVAADETNGILDVCEFEKLAHKDDFSAYSLPNVPSDRVLWWNADYILYLVKETLKPYDYYILIEYDVFINVDIDEIIEKCADRKLDFVAHSIMPSSPQWYRDTIIEVTAHPFWALIPILIVSSRALDLLFHTRRKLAQDLADGIIKKWPYCEVYLPTIMKMNPEMRMAYVGEFADVNLLRWRPFVSSRDPALNLPNVIAHPVLVGSRFIRANFLNPPPGTTGFVINRAFISSISSEDPAEVYKVFGDYEATIEREESYTELAVEKPATQSSRWRWARGATLGEDARRAVSRVLQEQGFVTDWEDNAWWQVDLESYCDIYYIEVINNIRNSSRFSRFEIHCSLNGKNWDMEFVKLDDEAISSDACRPSVFQLSKPTKARFVRIVQLGNNHFHLRRVRILGRKLSG